MQNLVFCPSVYQSVVTAQPSDGVALSLDSSFFWRAVTTELRQAALTVDSIHIRR
jgi:hypothetical protein